MVIAVTMVDIIPVVIVIIQVYSVYSMPFIPSNADPAYSSPLEQIPSNSDVAIL